MIQVLHISAECYPAAKTGGLGDVVGSLPKYMSQSGVLSASIIPKYSTKWINHQNWITVYQGTVWVNWRQRSFRVQQQAGNELGFPLFVVDIPGLFDRPGIYNDPSGAPYGDEIERYITFQQTVLEWLMSFPWHDRPRVLHCHDHHTAFIPWMIKYCPAYRQLAPIPTVFTIHNGQYQGAFGWNNAHLLPPYEGAARGLLDWQGIVNPMATAIKTAWAVTTVSESYLFELHESSLGLESLFRQEWHKEYGIVNGIDAQVWDPATDPALQNRLDGNHISKFKLRNKRALCEWFGFPYDAPIISFIGRLVGEKGGDLLPDAFKRFMNSGIRASFLVLGTGESWTENQFRAMAHQFPGRFNAVIDYNEALAHQIYAGSDFLIMPSRVEPCGLNQMYAMRYGTIPIVRSIGGLKDTVPDIGEPDGIGRGIRFDQFSLDDVSHALYRAVSMWHHEPGIVDHLRERIMAVDFSWENTVERYYAVYRRVGAYIETRVTAPAPEPSVEKKGIVSEEPSMPAKPEKSATTSNPALRAKTESVKKEEAPPPVTPSVAKPVAPKAGKRAVSPEPPPEAPVVATKATPKAGKKPEMPKPPPEAPVTPPIKQTKSPKPSKAAASPKAPKTKQKD